MGLLDHEPLLKGVAKKLDWTLVELEEERVYFQTGFMSGGSEETVAFFIEEFNRLSSADAIACFLRDKALYYRSEKKQTGYRELPKRRRR